MDSVRVSVDTSKFDEMLQHAFLVCDEESRKMLDRASKRVLKHARQITKDNIENRTGNYAENWKTEKATRSSRGILYVKYGNKSHHAHLIEDGHRTIDVNGKEHDYTPGRKIMYHANTDASEEIVKELEEFVDNLIKGGKI